MTGTSGANFCIQVLGAHELFIVENIHHNPELQWDEKCDLDLACLQRKDELAHAHPLVKADSWRCSCLALGQLEAPVTSLNTPCTEVQGTLPRHHLPSSLDESQQTRRVWAFDGFDLQPGHPGGSAASYATRRILEDSALAIRISNLQPPFRFKEV